MKLAAARAAFALIAAAPLFSGGCYHVKTHEPAVPYARTAAITTHVASRLSKDDAFRTPYRLEVTVDYAPPEVNEFGTGEGACVDVVPLWPYGRGEWPIPAEVRALGPALRSILAPHFDGPGLSPPAYALEVAFTPGTFRRFTRTGYGLSIFAGVLYTFGAPISYSTVSLEADLRLRDLRRADAQGNAPVVLERRVAGVETACQGIFLYFLTYNSMARRPGFWGADALRWDEIAAEALVDFSADAIRAIGGAFPRRCARCRLDYETGVEKCDACGGPLASP